jgi:hypothetical protein
MQATATDRFSLLLPLSGADRKSITQAAKARHRAILGKTAAYKQITLTYHCGV